MLKNKNQHRKLCEVAAKWLKRPSSTGGHGCHLALIEPACYGENCDVIGYRHGAKNISDYDAYAEREYISNYDVGTILIEAKTSRADFLNDAKKPHRIDPQMGVGKWRYYICPEGLINVEDLPPKWGLIWVNKRGNIKVIHGAAFGRGVVGSTFNVQRQFGHFAFVEWQRNTQREQSILIMALKRIEGVESLIYLQRELTQCRAKYLELQNIYNQNCPDRTNQLMDELKNFDEVIQPSEDD